MEGSYIDVNSLVSSLSNEFTVLTDVPELRRALVTASSVKPEGKILLRFQGTNLTFLCQGTYGRASSSLQVIPLTGAPHGDYWFMIRQLADCLHSLSGTAKLGIAQGGMLTLDTERAFYMQTGIRPPSDLAEQRDGAAA